MAVDLVLAHLRGGDDPTLTLRAELALEPVSYCSLHLETAHQ
jgi:hypothetical protein